MMAQITPANLNPTYPTNPNNTETIISQNQMIVKIISMVQIVSYLLIIVGIIVGIIYMVISKKKTINKIIIGIVIMLVPVILTIALSLIKLILILS